MDTALGSASLTTGAVRNEHREEREKSSYIVCLCEPFVNRRMREEASLPNHLIVHVLGSVSLALSCFGPVLPSGQRHFSLPFPLVRVIASFYD